MRALGLKKSLHDRVLKPAEERMLGVRLHDIDENRDVIVASFHAAPLTALNSLRRHQIRTALNELQQLGQGLPALMVGDYNYPVFKENLGQKVREQGYELNLSDARTYTRYRFFRGHYDFATSIGFEIDRVRTLPQGLSDHLPILVTARASESARSAASDRRGRRRRLSGVRAQARRERRTAATTASAAAGDHERAAGDPEARQRRGVEAGRRQSARPVRRPSRRRCRRPRSARRRRCCRCRSRRRAA